MTKNRKGGGGTVNARLNVPSGSPQVAVTFTSPWNEKKGSVLEFTNGVGNAFVSAKQLETKSSTMAAKDLPASTVLDFLFDKTSKFATYGAPVNIKINADSTNPDGLRTLDVSFTASGPSLTVDRRIAVGLRTIGRDAVLVVAGAPKSKWTESQEDASSLVSTLQVSLAPPVSRKDDDED
eukprot:CAMPEP_0185769572 /NCGR_PEP_ID=MMETSP1174-20130828/54780_1 /TAXON_ID=35687 /ORGANISM="Dictyocha speculum, Strain CCMP1381" /LENGTH=179 /DNA_ID=CAMNT_0028454689 /DNA_START=373 /DNA_END=912 /DNA_ORIENTATION=+